MPDQAPYCNQCKYTEHPYLAKWIVWTPDRSEFAYACDQDVEDIEARLGGTREALK